MYVEVAARNVPVHVAACGSVEAMISTSWDGTIWVESALYSAEAIIANVKETTILDQSTKSGHMIIIDIGIAFVHIIQDVIHITHIYIGLSKLSLTKLVTSINTNLTKLDVGGYMNYIR